MLRSFQINPARWCLLIEHFAELFGWAAGTPEHLDQRAKRGGKQWLQASKSYRDEFT